MDREVAINRVIRDMNLQGLISRDLAGEVRSAEAKIYLGALYTAGWEEKGRLHGDRRSREIIQMTAAMKEMQRFHNATQAGKILHCAKRTIRKSLNTGEPTDRGHIWRYADERVSGS